MCIEVEHFFMFYLLFSSWGIFSCFSLLIYLWELSCFLKKICFSHLFLRIISLSLLLTIIFLVLPCKNFNWNLIVYESDYQNVNKCNRVPGSVCLNAPLRITLSFLRTATFLPPRQGNSAESSSNLYLYMLYSLINQNCLLVYEMK